MSELTESLIYFFISASILIVLFVVISLTKKKTPSNKSNTSVNNTTTKKQNIPYSPKTKVFIQKRRELYTLLADDFIHKCDLFFEVSVLCYVLSGFALTAVGINPTLLFQEFRISTAPCDENKFNRRINLYMSLDDISLRDYCHLLDLNNNPDFVYQCITLFFDIIIHPECADNYQSAPFQIADTFWLLSIKNKYFPEVYRTAVHLINEIIK